MYVEICHLVTNAFGRKLSASKGSSELDAKYQMYITDFPSIIDQFLTKAVNP